MDTLPSLNALKAFEAVARHLNFTKAANELCVTQGAVSRQVKNLEDELNIKLFSRIPNRLSLTRDGEKLYQSVHQAFLKILEAKKNIIEKNSILKIITAPTFATRWLIPRLYRFQEKNPGLQIQLATSIQKKDFNHYSHFDIVITYGKPKGGSNLIVEPLFEETLVPVCSPKLISSSEASISLNDFSHHNILHRSLDGNEWQAWGKMAGVNLGQNLGMQSFELEESSIQASKTGAGISLVNLYFVIEELKEKTLTLPFPDLSPMPLNTYCLVFHESSRNLTPLKDFTKWILQERNLCLKKTAADFNMVTQRLIKGESEPAI